MASAAVARRRGSASTSKAAAKRRRQKVFVAVLAVVLAALLLYEVPRTLKLVGKAAPGQVAAAPSAPASEQSPGRGTKRFHGSRSGADPFAARSMPNDDTRPAGAGGPDPFTAPAASSPAEAAPVQPATALPKQIVIGRPGSNRVARHGWIVILASISSRNGHSEAVGFARSARRNVGPLSVLNSSLSRSLRSGYWVVYSGPYATLARVSTRVGEIHAAGYRTAYLRELIAYR